MQDAEIGSAVGLLWFKFGKLWFGFGSDVLQVWFRFAFRFGSSLVQVWFKFGSVVLAQVLVPVLVQVASCISWFHGLCFCVF